MDTMNNDVLHIDLTDEEHALLIQLGMRALMKEHVKQGEAETPFDPDENLPMMFRIKVPSGEYVRDYYGALTTNPDQALLFDGDRATDIVSGSRFSGKVLTMEKVGV